MENEYPAITLLNEVLAKWGPVYISTLYPSPLNYWMILCQNPFYHEFLEFNSIPTDGPNVLFYAVVCHSTMKKFMLSFS